MTDMTNNGPEPMPNNSFSAPPNSFNAPPPTIVVIKKNSLGTAGFVLAIVGLVLSWIPLISVIAWLPWLLGAIFSIIGVFKAPRGLAIAGVVISFIDLIILIAGIASLGAILL